MNFADLSKNLNCKGSMAGMPTLGHNSPEALYERADAYQIVH
jgi:hypothetical protein